MTPEELGRPTMKDRETERQKDRKTERQKDRKTERQKDSKKDSEGFLGEFQGTKMK